MYKLIPLSLYIHIPWCIKKCHYCDFNSYTIQNIIPETKYIEHLLQDLENDIQFIKDRNINTIFIGGGTPSLFHHTSIQILIEKIKNRIPILDIAEINIEANPNTFDTKNFIHYKKIGINRLSLGIQTFNPKILKIIGRNYNVNNTLNAIKTAKLININLNLDLMFGLPGQTLDDSLLDLKKAIKYHPNHISWYQLTIEPNTIFYQKPPILPKEDKIFHIMQKGEKLLKISGYQKYEISSYSKYQYECKHNLNYWNFGDYIGIGCGAHSKITKKNGTIIRIIKNKNPYHFMNGKYINSINNISKKDIPFEYFMNTFRIYKPILKEHFQKTTNIQEKYIKKDIDIAIYNGYLIETNYAWHVTNKGMNFLNSLLEIFLH